MEVERGVRMREQDKCGGEWGEGKRREGRESRKRGIEKGILYSEQRIKLCALGVTCEIERGCMFVEMKATHVSVRQREKTATIFNNCPVC